MAVYDASGNALSAVYDASGNTLSTAYDASGSVIFTAGDYSEYDNEYQHAILQARDEWKTQYRADSDVIPLVLHTDQHGKFITSNTEAVDLFAYLGLAVNWDEVSAMVGLGDVDLTAATYSQMNTVLNGACGRDKQINIWGNHDLWKNYTTDANDDFVVDFETTYPYFSNETYGDESHAYNHKGIEYHIDEAHNIKYVCFAGWEIDAALGGRSHYVIGSASMEGLIDALEGDDGHDIILLTHCNPYSEQGQNMTSSYEMSAAGTGTEVSNALYSEPVAVTWGLGNCVVHPSDTNLRQLLADRNACRSGSVNDSYGNAHSYDFTNCTGKILCGFQGHIHLDAYGWSTPGILQIVCDAYAYQTHPFYFINVDRNAETVTLWKVMNDGTYGSYTVPFYEPLPG